MVPGKAPVLLPKVLAPVVDDTIRFIASGGACGADPVPEKSGGASEVSSWGPVSRLWRKTSSR
jgi:hypothetical protein